MRDIIYELDKYCFSCWEWVPSTFYVHDEVQCAVCSIAMDEALLENQSDTHLVSVRDKYYNRVKTLTYKNAHMIEGIDTRGKYHQIDHMISIAYGFDNNIPPEHLAHTTNLQMLPSRDNQSKGRANNITPHNRWILE